MKENKKYRLVINNGLMRLMMLFLNSITRLIKVYSGDFFLSIDISFFNSNNFKKHKGKNNCHHASPTLLTHLHF